MSLHIVQRPPLPPYVCVCACVCVHVHYGLRGGGGGVLDDELCNDLQEKPISRWLMQCHSVARQRPEKKDSLSCKTQPASSGFDKKKGQQQGHHHQPAHNKTPTFPNRPHHKQGSRQYCGHGAHTTDKCPARRTTRGHCSKEGHCKAVCRSWLRRVNELLEEDSNSEDGC